MERGISKNELVWVITRVIGAVFLWFAIVKVGTVIALLYSSSRMDGFGLGVSGSLVSVALKPLVFIFSAYVGLAYYFLYRGEGFVKMVSRMGGIEIKRRMVNAGPDSFQEWLCEDPSHAGYPYEQQLSMYEEWRVNRY